jgi:hypothetical protein
MDEINNEWLIIHTPTGSWVWDLGTPTPDERGDLTNRARVMAGFPANNDWVGSDDAAVMLTYGRPHDSLMARATVGTVADLARVNDDESARYAAAMAEVHQRIMVDAARDALLALPADAQAALRTEVT